MWGNESKQFCRRMRRPEDFSFDVGVVGFCIGVQGKEVRFWIRSCVARIVMPITVSVDQLSGSAAQLYLFFFLIECVWSAWSTEIATSHNSRLTQDAEPAPPMKKETKGGKEQAASSKAPPASKAASKAKALGKAKAKNKAKAKAKASGMKKNNDHEEEEQTSNDGNDAPTMKRPASRKEEEKKSKESPKRSADHMEEAPEEPANNKGPTATKRRPPVTTPEGTVPATS